MPLPETTPAAAAVVVANAVAADDFEGRVAALWQRGLAGDEAAYRELLEALARRLRAFFARRLAASCPDDVEDLVQETLLALHLQRATYEPGVPLGAWVYAIARHKLVDLWRRRGRREALHEPLDGLEEVLAAPAAEEGPARRDLEQLLNQLPEAQQRAIALTRIEGLSMAEASARSGVSVAALKVQVHRGLKKLAELVRREGADSRPKE